MEASGLAVRDFLTFSGNLDLQLAALFSHGGYIKDHLEIGNDMKSFNTASTVPLLALFTSGVMLVTSVSAQTSVSIKSTSAAKTMSDVPNVTVEPVDIKLDRKKVTIAEGKEVLASATQARPGDVLQDTATYTNLSKKNTRRVEATLPVPPFTEPMLGSIIPSNAKASIDGTSFAAIPLRRQVRQANGVMLEQVVPLAEYRFLRWSAIELAPEKKFIASARFRMLDNTPVTINVTAALPVSNDARK